MDEIIIDDKRYISSKRAAKITGYAKDYVGQLCREGRVPARLVGRNWYVLETAIQDHRFGDINAQPEESAVITPIAEDVVQEKITSPESPVMVGSPIQQSKWESPRYEATVEDFLPSVNRLRAEAENTIVSGEIEENTAKVQIEDTWRDWFDHIANTVGTAPVAKDADIEKYDHIEKEDSIRSDDVSENDEITSNTSEEDVSVPIHTVYDLPHANQESYIQATNEAQAEPQYIAKYGVRQKTTKIIQIVSILCASLAIVIAVIGSGHIDTYIISNNLVSKMTGLVIFNK